ncbi:MAG: thioredoxin family protein [Desulfobacterales bacterium]
MTPAEEQRIRDFNNEIAGDNIKIIIERSDLPQSMEIEAFGKKLIHLLPSAAIKMETAEDNTSFPAVILGNALHYHAVPLGKELDPFLEALKMSADTSGTYVSQIAKRLANLNSVALFDIFITSQCPHCPLTVKTFVPLCFASHLIRVSIIDAALFPEAAATRNVRSVPTTLLDESFRWTGAIDLDEIINIIKKRDPAHLSTESLKKMLHEGLAGKVAEMMVQKGFIFSNFIELLCHPKWTVRLGAMVTIEELAAQDSKLAAQVEKPLWNRFFDLDDSVKGDMLHVLGETGNGETLIKLDSVLKESYNNDIQEAAGEAMEAIRRRLAVKGT